MPSLASDPAARAAWFPAMLSRGLAAGDVRAVRLLGEDIVVWRGSDGIHAWQDLCIHRGVKLSLGTVLDGCALRCAYHGWTYDGSGRCTRMPAHPEQKPPPRAKVRKYNVAQCGGLVWVCLGEPTGAPPHLAECDDAMFRAISCGPYPVEAGAPRLIENFLDVAHLPIVHEGALGVPGRAEIAPYDVTSSEGRPVARDIRIFQPNPEGHGRAGEVSYEYGVLSPFTVYLRKQMPGGERFVLLFAVAPVTEVESVAYFTAFLNYGDPAKDSDIVEFQNRIFAQDIPIVTSQRPERLPLDLAEELHLPSDRLAIAYRQYIRGLGLTFGTA